MNTINIQGSTITFKGKKLSIDSLYTTEFLKASDEFAVEVNFDSYFVNELFINTFQPYLAFKLFIESESITKIILDKPNVLLQALSLDIAKRNCLEIVGESGSLLLWNKRLSAYGLFIVTAFYLVLCMLRIPKRKVIINHPQGVFSISRSASTEKKLRNFNYPLHIEDFRSKTSMYSYYDVLRRVYWVVQSYWNAISQLSKIKSKVKEHAGKYSIAIIYSFYASRMVHTLLYEKLLNAFFKSHSHQTLYTGNNLDRFSVVEEVIANKYGIKTVCIPHGLEYGFRFPKGFSCDIFYATSSHAASYLNSLYNTKKFLFDQSIAERMYKISTVKKDSIKKLVFFTEPREGEVNVFIINNLLPKLKKLNLTLYIKLHPKDCKSNYSTFDIQYLESIEEALVGNVCFARKSTTLLECIYNGSNAAAIILNSKDEALFYTFPSLQSDLIQVTKNIDSLFEWIKLNIKKEIHEQI